MNKSITVLLSDDFGDNDQRITRWSIWLDDDETNEWKGGIVDGSDINVALAAALAAAKTRFNDDTYCNVVANDEDLYCETIGFLGADL